ncbi:hypothetical protein Moror_4972 [Moniliophthora roreri MCA 2997]|uniref:Uncharacterized protein n=2 Tax=Moniliophthora roreri TaxID=221103 RepID=V2Y438_MONRO|nr:hypothetical protein Moror_4972 [Moniliophthora roreri MCA 2997]
MSLEEILNSKKEQEIGEREFDFLDTEEGLRKIVEHVKKGDSQDPIEILDDEEEEDERSQRPTATPSEIIDMCGRVEKICLGNPELEPGFTLSIVQSMRKVRGIYNQKKTENMQQSSLDQFIRVECG